MNSRMNRFDHVDSLLPPFRWKWGVWAVRAANSQGVVWWGGGGGRRTSRWWRGTPFIPFHLGHAAPELVGADFLVHRHRRARSSGTLAAPSGQTEGRLPGKSRSFDPRRHPGNTIRLLRCRLGPSNLPQSRGRIRKERAGEDGGGDFDCSWEEGAAQRNWDHYNPTFVP